MTIQTEDRKAGPFPGDGVTVNFDFGFKVFAETDVLVIQAVTATGAETEKTITTDYTVTLNPNQESSPGGRVTMLVAPPAGQTITLTSEVPNLQGKTITSLGGFFPQVLNDALDRLTVLVQQVRRDVARSVKVNISSTTTPDQLLSDINTSVTAAVASASAAATSETNAAASATSSAVSASSAAADLASAQTLLLAAKLGQSAAIASAATMDFTARTGNLVPVTGTATTTAATMSNGDDFVCVAPTGWVINIAGVLSYTTVAGDRIHFKQVAGVQYATPFRKDGSPLIVGKGPTVGAFRNLQASATGTNSTVIASADELVVEDSGNRYQTLRSVAISINTASSGANGLDTGALATSTWYSVWVIAKDDGTTAGLISTSATAPTMPSGYTHKARVGWIRTDGTENKYPQSFKQLGRTVQYVVASGSNVTRIPPMAAGVAGSVATPTWVAVSTANYVPSTAHTIKISALSPLATGNRLILAPNNSYGSESSTTNPPVLVVGNGSSGIYTAAVDLLLESSSVYWAAAGSNCQISCFGWEDNL